MISFDSIISQANNFLWSYVLVILLLGCAFWFTYKTDFVQFKMFKRMVQLLTQGSTHKKHGSISSFEAFAISLASRVGTGNLAGVATAIAVGGPGAIFWMWVIALFEIGRASCRERVLRLV